MSEEEKEEEEIVLPWRRQRRGRRRRWFLMGLCMVVETNGDEYDRSNPLWRENYFFTGEQRGPRTKDSLSPRILGRLPCREPLQFAAMNGGQQESLTSSNGPPVLFNRWMQYRSRRGTITIDLGEPELDKEQQHEVEAEAKNESVDIHVENSNCTVLEASNTTNTALRVLSKLPRPIIRQSDSSSILKHQNVELSISISPSSMFRLFQNLLHASAGFAGAFGATLRLLAPMILARRVISTVGYICYDYYNGRYIRTTYNRHSQLVQQYEIPSALRACGRMGLQLLSMVFVGTISRIVLNPAPCLMPTGACRYWYGSVWVTSVLLASQSMRFWMKKFPALQVETVTASNSQGLLTPTTFFTRPWHILQWLKDPETWLLNLTKLQRHPNRRRDNFRPDPLLFPSTWPPLHILSAIAMVHAIAQTLPIRTGANTRILMQDYCLAVTVLDEWKRVFLFEHRIALGLVWSAISFAAFFVLASSAALEVGWISSALLLPVVFACLVSGWMNTVLYSERYVQRL